MARNKQKDTTTRTPEQIEADQRYEEKRRGTRTRNWLFILYPESAPENWRDLLDEMHIPWIESPLHDKDVIDDGNNTKKKDHKHIMLMYPIVKNFEQVKEITDALNQPIPQPCRSTAGSVRYFAHLDNPEKAQYSRDEIIGHNGVDVQRIIDTSSDRTQTIKDIITWINENDCYRFNDLVNYAMAENEHWFNLLVNGYTRFLSEYLKDKWHQHKEEQETTDKEFLESYRAKIKLLEKKGSKSNG